jgi:hypothetical protein
MNGLRVNEKNLMVEVTIEGRGPGCATHSSVVILEHLPLLPGQKMLKYAHCQHIR